jgi:hypothetical protein
LITSLRNDDRAKAQQVKEYIKSRFNKEKYAALLPEEDIILNYWLKDYNEIFSIIINDGIFDQDYENKLLPLRDLLYNELKEISTRNLNMLYKEISSASLPSYKKDFLALLLNYLITIEQNASEEVYKEINRQADDYLSIYSDSEFNPFIRTYIRFVIAESPWGYGLEFSFGYLSLPVQLGRYVEDYGLVTLGFEAAYKKIYGSLRMDIGPENPITRSFEYNGIWKDKLKVMHIGVSFLGGPMISLGNNFILTPLAGISYMDFSPTEEEKANEGNDVSMSFMAWSLGLNFDIPMSNILFLRFNIGHRIANTDIVMAKGGYTYITIGIDMFVRSIFRDY